MAGQFEIYSFSLIMFPSLSQAFVSILNLFRPTMSNDDITNLLFDPDNKVPMSTGNLLFMLSSWSRRTEEPPSITDWRQFEIVCLIHSKNPEPPEHEYLIIEIKDRVHEENHFLVLERFTSPTPAPADTSDKEFTEKFMQFLTTLKKSPLKLMEEGSSS